MKIETGQNWSLAIAGDILTGSILGHSRETLANLDFISTNQVCLVCKTLKPFHTEFSARAVLACQPKAPTSECLLPSNKTCSFVCLLSLLKSSKKNFKFHVP